MCGMQNIFSLEAYDYSLPESLIAQHPHEPPDECKLLIYERNNQTISDTQFSKALQWLDQHHVLFFNNSKVVKARIPLAGVTTIYKNKSVKLKEGELFYLQAVGNKTYQFYVYPGNKLQVWTTIILGKYELSIVDNFDLGRIIYFAWDIFELLEIYGQMPLPPYIVDDRSKGDRYQPVVAAKPWSVASPTASLHFTAGLLDGLESQGVILDNITLHIGIGTFRPIEAVNILDHAIHTESVEIDLDVFKRIMDYKLTHKLVIAVWTTSCRTLESLPYLFKILDTEFDCSKLLDKQVYEYRSNCCDAISLEEAGYYIGEWIGMGGRLINFPCKLYIIPGFQFRIIDQLITNFHLPKSSLMVLVAAFMGYEAMMEAYDQAIKKNYSFYSFGDAMWIQ